VVTGRWGFMLSVMFPAIATMGLSVMRRSLWVTSTHVSFPSWRAIITAIMEEVADIFSVMNAYFARRPVLPRY